MRPLRYLAIISATVLTATVVAACGASTSAGGQQSLTIWSEWLRGQPGQQFLQGVVNDFQKQTGITVTVVWKGSNVTKALLPALNSAQVPTDIVETSAAAIQTSLYPTGAMLDLANAYKTQVSGTGQTVAQVVGDAATSLSVPVDANGTKVGGPVVVPYWADATNVFFYNGAKFPALAANPPANWTDFMKVLDAQQAKGRKPLAQDGSIQSYNALYFSNFLTSIAGQDALAKASLDKSGQTWLQPAYLQAAQLVQTLAKGGYFINGYDASKFPAMEDDWANNDADFDINGTWLPGEVANVAAPGFQYKSFPFPAVTGHASPPLAAAVNGIGILNKSKHQDAAIKFAAFLLQKQYQQQVSSTMQEIPIARGVAAPAPIEAIKKSFDAGNIATFRFPAGLADYVTKVYYEYDDQLIFGKITAQQFVAQMASASQQYWKSAG